jgi:hypothetical protein
MISIKRDRSKGHIHVYGASVAPCDDPEDQEQTSQSLHLCLWFLSFHPCLHFRVHKKVPVNTLCVQKTETHDYLGSKSSVRILEVGSVVSTCENSG